MIESAEDVLGADAERTGHHCARLDAQRVLVRGADQLAEILLRLRQDVLVPAIVLVRRELADERVTVQRHPGGIAWAFGGCRHPHPFATVEDADAVEVGRVDLHVDGLDGPIPQAQCLQLVRTVADAFVDDPAVVEPTLADDTEQGFEIARPVDQPRLDVLGTLDVALVRGTPEPGLPPRMVEVQQPLVQNVEEVPDAEASVDRRVVVLGVDVPRQHEARDLPKQVRVEDLEHAFDDRLQVGLSDGREVPVHVELVGERLGRLAPRRPGVVHDNAAGDAAISHSFSMPG